VTERAPTWPEELRGTIIGLTPVTSSSDILRAVTTSTFYRLADILDELRKSVSGSNEIIVSGGILHSPASLNILADALGSDLRICRELESSLRGAAIHALHQLGKDATPLRAGKIVRYRPDLAKKHRARRLEQNALERFLISRTAL
jgi:gluconokinase